MAYIGTTPTKVVSRQSVVDYRYTATAGQTAFTGADLNNQVLACNPADMDVHLNGVRLDLTDWTATATTLTLAVGATAGDEITVSVRQTFEVADTYAKTTADDRFVNTAGDTMTGALALPSGGLNVGSGQLAVDASGRVTMPYQPAFIAYYAPATLTSAGVIIWEQTILNRGNCYNSSTGHFTAPVDGIYQFFASVRVETAVATAIYHRLVFQQNGTNVTTSASRLNSRNQTGYYSHASNDHIISLSAGDYVRVRFESTLTSISTNSRNEHVFYGYLIG